MKIKQIRLGGIVLSSNIFMAPLAGYTCYPFRVLCYELGAGLCTTEMVSCNALKYKDNATERLLLTTADEKIKSVQLIGSDSNLMEKMAKSDYLHDFDIIDLNMGCPVPNVFKSGDGSALILNMKKAANIIRSLKMSGKVITVKCRTGIYENKQYAAEIAKVCEDAGADLITIHGRTRSMMYDGTPYYNQIEQAKSSVSIPVFANGGIFSKEDADRVIDVTGADGIAIGRYGLQNPFIFSELIGKPILKTKRELLFEQIDIAIKYYDESFTLEYIKKIASHFMKKLEGSKKYKIALHGAGNIEEMKEIVDSIFGFEKAVI